MNILCKVCDRSIIENESENEEYLANLRKKKNKSLYKKFTVFNVDLDKIINRLNEYISTHNKIFDF